MSSLLFLHGSNDRPSSALTSSSCRLPASPRPGEVVVLWTAAVRGYVPALLAGRRPPVLSVHEILPGWLGSALGRLVARDPRLVMAKSMATSRWLERIGFELRRVRVVYPVAPARDPQPVASRGGGLGVLVAARISERKGQLHALEAATRLRARGVDVRVTLAGAPFPGQERVLARLLEQVQRSPWVSYAGEVKDLRLLLADHDVLLVPSVEPESFGLVALEAWAAGRRVIAPDEGGMAEAARMCDGLLYRPRDVTAMAAVLDQFVREPALRQLTRPHVPASVLCRSDERARFWHEALRHAEGKRAG